MSHMDGLIAKAEAARRASAIRLTAAESRAVRLAAGFGIATARERDQSREALRCAVAKLRVIERAA